MGKRGPQKMPQQLRLLRGEHHPSQLGGPEPVPSAAEPVASGWFDDRHRAVWDRITRQIGAMGILRAADADTLVALVRAIIRAEDGAQHFGSGEVICPTTPPAQLHAR